MPNQSYDPYKLINDVMELLTERGLSPERTDVEEPAARLTGACLLLRGLGVEPLQSPENSLDLDGHAAYNKRLHGD